MMISKPTLLLPLFYDGVRFAPSQRRRRRVRFALEENQVREYQLSKEEKEGKCLAFQRICANRHVAQLEYHQEQRQEAQQRARLNDDNNPDIDRFQPPRPTAPWNLQTAVLLGLVMMLPMLPILMRLHSPLCHPMSPTPTVAPAIGDGNSFLLPIPTPTKTALFLPTVGASSWACGSNNNYNTTSSELELVVLPCQQFIDISRTDVMLRGPTDLVLFSAARPLHHNSGNQVLLRGNTTLTVWIWMGDHQAVTTRWCFVLLWAAVFVLMTTGTTCFPRTFHRQDRCQQAAATTATTGPCCHRHSTVLCQRNSHERPWGKFEQRRIWMLVRTRSVEGNWVIRRIVRKVWMRPCRHPIQSLSMRRIRPRIQLELRRPTLAITQLRAVADAPISQPVFPTLLPPPQRILFLIHHNAAGCRGSLQHGGGDTRALLLVPSFSREIITDLHRRRLILDPLHFFGCVKFYRTHEGSVVVVSVVVIVPAGCWYMQCIYYFDLQQGLAMVVSVLVKIPAGHWHRQWTIRFVVVPPLMYLDRPLFLRAAHADVPMPPQPPPRQVLLSAHYSTAACGDYLEHGCGIRAHLLLLPPSASGDMIWDVPRGYMAPLQFLLHDAAGAGVPMRRRRQQQQQQEEEEERIFLLPAFNVACGDGACSGKGGEHDDLFRHDAADDLVHHDAADDFQLHDLHIPHCAGHDSESIDWSGTLELVFHEPEAIADCEDWSHGFHRLFRQQTRKRRRTVDAAVDWTDAFYLVFDVPVLRRSLRLASKPRVDYAGMC